MFKIFDQSKKELKKAKPIVTGVRSYAAEYKKLSDDELRGKTAEFRERLDKGESLESLMPEAYAAVVEASRRTLDLEHFDEQILGGIVLHQGRIAEQKTGEGKAVTLTTKIPTPDGWVTAGDVKVGNLLFDNYGNPVKVLAVYPQGKKEVYEVVLRDGRVIECAEDHLWSVYRGKNVEKLTVMDTKKMFDKRSKKNGLYKFYLPMAGAAKYQERHYNIDPYTMGTLIMHSRRNSSGAVILSSTNQKIIDYVTESIGAKSAFSNESTNDYSFYFGERKDGARNQRIKIGDLDGSYKKLICESMKHERYIPREYLLGSYEQRLALLQGILDNEGSFTTNNSQESLAYNMYFRTTSSRLAEDFQELVFSLGWSASESQARDSGTGTLTHKQNIIRIDLPVSDKTKLFRFSDKADKALHAVENEHRKRDYTRIPIMEIRKTGRMEEQVCFTVDSPDHLFLAGMYVVTHNTLTATCPAYLNALPGRGVHIVTVNDYLASRDAQQMGQVFRFLGMNVGAVLHDMKPPERKSAYACDITYVTNNELGFDYLRDNMATSPDAQVLRGLNYCIIDEVDSILIDEARTPLIISGPSGKPTSLYVACDALAKSMARGEDVIQPTKMDLIMGEAQPESGDFMVSEKEKSVLITADGVSKTETFFHIKNLSDPGNLDIQHGINTALRANYLMHRDKDYVVKEGEVLIVDSFTGRAMPGRRYSDGLHQAIEAKEGVEIKQESQTLATITFQSFFNKFKKKSGMTGTAKTEEREFRSIYGMDVICIPTHKPVVRVDHTDKVYRTKEEKYRAVVKDVIKTWKKGQPVLVGTTTIETSELLSRMLRKKGIKHHVLNAKFHEMEAHIVEHAGEFKSVTIATNMAGRGTDIKLDDKARSAGGLKIIGTERHEARRIDNQLRGRSGRQGDPGESVFYISLEDDLMRLFGSNLLADTFDEMDIKYGESIESKMLARAITRAQKSIEGSNFDTRDSLMKFDSMGNEQREIVYGEREEILCSDGIQDGIERIIEEVAIEAENEAKKSGQPAAGLIRGYLPSGYKIPEKAEEMTAREILMDAYKAKEKDFTNPAEMRRAEKSILLKTLDRAWISHLENLDYLKEGIGLRAYGQKDPVIEYRTAGYEMFDEMLDSVRKNTIRSIMRLKGTRQIQAATQRIRIMVKPGTDIRKAVENAVKNAVNGPVPENLRIVVNEPKKPDENPTAPEAPMEIIPIETAPTETAPIKTPEKTEEPERESEQEPERLSA